MSMVYLMRYSVETDTACTVPYKIIRAYFHLTSLFIQNPLILKYSLHTDCFSDQSTSLFFVRKTCGGRMVYLCMSMRHFFLDHRNGWLIGSCSSTAPTHGCIMTSELCFITEH